MALSKKITQLLARLERDVERTTYAMLKAGNSSKDIQKAIANILSELNIYSVLRSELYGDADNAVQLALSKAERQYNWVLTHSQQSTVYNAVLSSTNNVLANAGQLDVRITERVAVMIANGTEKGNSRSAIVNDVAAAVKRGAFVVSTWENTARAGMATTSNVAIAKAVGVSRMKFVGAGAQRQFCKDNLDVIRTIAEWQQLSNGHGLPVLQYCGGYNCVHTLEPVIE
jgi:hypothetical protein